MSHDIINRGGHFWLNPESTANEGKCICGNSQHNVWFEYLNLRTEQPGRHHSTRLGAFKRLRLFQWELKKCRACVPGVQRLTSFACWRTKLQVVIVTGSGFGKHQKRGIGGFCLNLWRRRFGWYLPLKSEKASEMLEIKQSSRDEWSNIYPSMQGKLRAYVDFQISITHVKLSRQRLAAYGAGRWELSLILKYSSWFAP